MATQHNRKHTVFNRNDKLGSKYGQPQVLFSFVWFNFGQELTYFDRFPHLIAAIFCSAAILTSSAARAVTESENGEKLLGPSINQTVAGRRIYLSVPFGGEFPLYYQKDGRVDGSGEAIGLGKFLSPTDSGKWWVENNRLCQKWSQWYDGKVFCFTLEKLPDNKLIWRRDDGEEGVARIGP
jgi:hypothetical protein